MVLSSCQTLTSVLQIFLLNKDQYISAIAEENGFDLYWLISTRGALHGCNLLWRAPFFINQERIAPRNCGVGCQ